MNTLYIAFVAVFMVINSCLSALNQDELKKQYMGILIECSKEYILTPEDMVMLRNKQIPDKEPVKCLFACALKKTKLMDDSGKLSVDGVNSLMEKYFADDPVKIEKTIKFTEACQSVNNEPVSDGDRGCDRAALIYKCSTEKALEMDFIV